MVDFIDGLTISETDKAKLSQLGADSPAALFSMMEAAPQEFATFLGEATAVVRAQLMDIVPRSQLPLTGRSSHRFALGAEVSPAPFIPLATPESRRRDRLFTEWEQLARNPIQSNSLKTKQLEDELNALLEGGAVNE